MSNRFKCFLQIKPRKKNYRDASPYTKSNFWLTSIATVLIVLGIATMVTLPKFLAFADTATGNGTQGTSASTGVAVANGTQGNALPPITITQQQDREDRSSNTDTDKKETKDKDKDKDKSDSNRTDIMKAYSLASKKQQKAIQGDVKTKISKFGEDGNKASKSDWSDFVSAMKKEIKPNKKGNKAQKALYSALNSKKSDSSDLDKDDDDDDGSGKNSKSDSVQGVMKALKNGDYSAQKPHTLAGKIGQAIFNFFWSMSAGKWLQKNSIGGTIFGGATTTSGLKKIVDSDPVRLMYPGDGTGGHNMFIVSNWLEPAMMGLAFVFMAVALIINATKMGWHNFSDPGRSRVEFYHSIIDTGISLVGLWAYPSIIITLLQFDGVLVLGLNSWMNMVQVYKGTSLLQVAIKLGVDGTTINMLTSGGLGGAEFAGALFSLIYLFTYLGLAIWIKYYYFIRSMVFTILISIGPLFIAFWSSDWGKSRALNWMKELISTIYVQVINALVLTFMSLFMAWNNTRMLQASAELIVAQNKWASQHTIANFFSNWPLIGGVVSSSFHRPIDAGANGFEIMVIGFIIMITFQPLSKSLAELFGLQTNMLDNIHQSTSNTLQTGAFIGGSALGLAALGVGNVVLAKKGLEGAGDVFNGLKNAKNVKDKGFKGKFKAFRNGIKDKKQARLDARLAKHKKGTWGDEIMGIMGAGAGQMVMASAGLGAGANPLTIASLTRAGGKIGVQASSLARGGLNKLGLQAQKLGKKIPHNPFGLKKEKEDANKDKDTITSDMVKNTVSAIDKANGKDATSDQADKMIENFKKAHKDGYDKNNDRYNDKGVQEEYERVKAQAKKAKEWQKMSPEQKEKFVRQQLSKAIHGDGDGDVGFATLSDIKKASRDTITEKINPTKYDKDNKIDQAVENGTLTKEAVDAKAKHFGLTDINNDFRDRKQGESEQDYLKAKNDNLNNILKKGQDAVESSAMDSFGVDVADYAKDEIYNSPNSNGLRISNSQFKANLSKKLGNLGFDKKAIQSRLDAFDKEMKDNDNVKQMVTSVHNPYGDDTAVLNSEVYNAFVAGQQQLLNSATQLGNITSDDVQMASAHDFSQERSDEIINQSKQLMKDHMKAEYASKQALAETGIRRGGDIVNPYSVTSWIDGLGGTGGSGSFYGGGNPSYDKYNQRIMAYNHGNTHSSLGMSMDEAREMSASAGITDPKTGQKIIPNGVFRIVTTNGSSMMQVRDDAGTYHMVGNLGLGDATLDQGEEVYTDLDMSNGNIPVFAKDPVTHQSAGSYTLSADGKSHIPFTFRNGFVPDINSMIPSLGQQKTTPVEHRSTFQGGMFVRAPEYQNSLVSPVATLPTIQQMQNNGYDHFKLVFANDPEHNGRTTGLITAEKDGKEMAICPQGDLSSFFDSKLSVPNGGVVSVPMRFNGDHLVCKDFGDNPITLIGGGQDNASTRAYIEQLSSKLGQKESNRRLSNFLEDHLIFSTGKVGTNEISNNPAWLSENHLDVFNKNV